MNRKQTIEKAAQALWHQTVGTPERKEQILIGEARDLGIRVIDAILPQVSTVEELEALPEGTKLIDEAGTLWWIRNTRRIDPDFPVYLRNDADHFDHPASARRLPLTIVWQP